MIRHILKSPAGAAGVVLLATHLFLAAFGPLLVPRSPNALAPDRVFHAPAASSPFGTDQFGRDMFSRVIVGGRVALAIALSATFLAVTAGGLIGVWAGYRGGLPDEVVMRLVDAIQ